MLLQGHVRATHEMSCSIWRGHCCLLCLLSGAWTLDLKLFNHGRQGTGHRTVSFACSWNSQTCPPALLELILVACGPPRKRLLLQSKDGAKNVSEGCGDSLILAKPKPVFPSRLWLWWVCWPASPLPFLTLPVTNVSVCVCVKMECYTCLSWSGQAEGTKGTEI